MTYERIKDILDERIKKYAPELALLSDGLADEPELAGEEYRSAQKLVSFLQKHGFAVEYPFSGSETAFRGIYGGNTHRYKIALLAEYDALPELGHACGHCLSGTASILAALALKELQDELDADIHVVGTPDEELRGYKCVMCEQGVFDGYDMASMVHMYDGNWAMPRLQALAAYIYEFRGQAAHASAAPWEGRNALNGVQLMLHAVDMLRQHTKTDAQFHAVIKNGGEAANIVPEHSSLQLFVRAADKGYLEELIRLVDDCARGAAIATQTTYERLPQKYSYYLNLRPNKTGEAALLEVFDELGLTEDVPPGAVFASSDIGNISYICPAFQPCLKIADVPIHTRGFEAVVRSEAAHEAQKTAASLLARQIVKIFSDAEKVAAMKADFNEKTSQ